MSKKLTKSEYQRLWREARKATGICIACKSEVEPGFYYCKKHIKAKGLTGERQRIRACFDTLTITEMMVNTRLALAERFDCSESTAGRHVRLRLKELNK